MKGLIELIDSFDSFIQSVTLSNNHFATISQYEGKFSLLAAITVSITLVIQMKVFLNNKFNITNDHNKSDTILVHKDARPLPPTMKQDKKPNDPDLLLSVPFYVYEDEFLNDSLWNITEI